VVVEIIVKRCGILAEETKQEGINLERQKQVLKKLLLDFAEAYKETGNPMSFGALLTDLRINFAMVALKSSNINFEEDEDKLLHYVLAFLIHEFFWLQVYFKDKNEDFLDEFISYVTPIKKMANIYHKKMSTVLAGEERPKYIS
jgi:hypothetical protein